MPPILAFFLGTFFSELMQWGIWLVGHAKLKEETRKAYTVRYFGDGLAHFLMAWSVCGMTCLLWYLGGLDVLVGLLPDVMTSAWANTAVPLTPQVGAPLGFLTNFMADKIAYAFRARFGGAAPHAPAPPAEGGGP